MKIRRMDESPLERWERIDGVIYDMSPPPTSDHQSILSNLVRDIAMYLKGKKRRVYPAPFGVWLDANDKGNYIEPDITIVCDPNKIRSQGCVGAPDMIMEIFSPSTALKDKTVKLRAYKVAGVREYWIVDGANEFVEIHSFLENMFDGPTIHGKNDTICVGIFPDLKINLEDIFSFAQDVDSERL